MSRPVHDDAARGELADDELRLDAETIPVRRTAAADGELDLELCAIPGASGLALGDRVRVAADDSIELVARSGHGVLRVGLPEDAAVAAALVEDVVLHGAVVERLGPRDLAVDVSPSVAAGVLAALVGWVNAGWGTVQLQRTALHAVSVTPEATDRARALIAELAAGLAPTTRGPIDRALHRGEWALAVEHLADAIRAADHPVSPHDYVGLLDTAGATGACASLVHGIPIATTVPGAEAASSTLAALLRDLDRIGPVEVLLPDGRGAPLERGATGSNEFGFWIGALPDARLLVSGTATLRSEADRLVLTGFSYAELFAVRPDGTIAGVAAEDGQVVLRRRPESAPVGPDRAAAIRALREELRDPRAARRGTTRWQPAETVGALAAGVGLGALGAGAIAGGEPLIGVPASLAAAGVLVSPLVARLALRRRATTAARDGWLAGGRLVVGPILRGTHVAELLLPVETAPTVWRDAERRLRDLLDDRASARTIARRASRRRAVRLATLDPNAPADAMVRLSLPRLGAEPMAFVVRRSASATADVLGIRGDVVSRHGIPVADAGDPGRAAPGR